MCVCICVCVYVCGLCLRGWGCAPARPAATLDGWMAHLPSCLAGGPAPQAVLQLPQPGPQLHPLRLHDVPGRVGLVRRVRPDPERAGGVARGAAELALHAVAGVARSQGSGGGGAAPMAHGAALVERRPKGVCGVNQKKAAGGCWMTLCTPGVQRDQHGFCQISRPYHAMLRTIACTISN